jgi:hypothetical protein
MFLIARNCPTSRSTLIDDPEKRWCHHKIHCVAEGLGKPLARNSQTESEKISMTDIQLFEHDVQNINSLNVHGSYCECIWCLERNAQVHKTSDLAKQEIEQEMMAMLKDLPLPIAITKQGDLHNHAYTWQCIGTSGKENSFVDATRQALQSLLEDCAVAQP